MLAWLAEGWAIFTRAFAILGGTGLLWLTYLNRTSFEDRGGGSTAACHVLQLLDYDQALVLLTFSFAVVWNVIETFYAEGMRLGLATWFASLLSFLAPVGNASFALSVWRSPPRRNSSREKTMGAALWFALFFALVQFTIFQDREDCEISSSMPGCCSFPDWFLTAYNEEDLYLKCNRPVRCHHAPAEGMPRCSLSEAKKESSDDALEHFSNDQCHKLHEEWEVFEENEKNGLELEVEEEEQGEASAYRLFKTCGQAATVEMCFTIIGVLLKVIFLTRHPNSNQILDLDQHHHVSDDQGQHRVVTVSHTPRENWAIARTAVTSLQRLARTAAASTEVSGPPSTEVQRELAPRGDAAVGQ